MQDMAGIPMSDSRQTNTFDENEGENNALTEQQTDSLNVKMKRKKKKCLVGSFAPNTATDKEKLKFRCYQAERKKKSEMNKMKIIQKLRKKYEICVDGFNDNVVNELIRRIELMERENREREKRNAEKTRSMLVKLLEEQKYRNRGNKVFTPPWRKKKIFFCPTNSDVLPSMDDMKMEKKIVRHAKNEMTFAEGVEVLPGEETSDGNKINVGRERLTPTGKRSKSQLSSNKVNSSASITQEEFISEDEEHSLIRRGGAKMSKCVTLEKFLESTPKRIVFQDYKRDQVHFQILKITNIGCETVHCRYLGIVVHKKQKGRFPIGVAVRDSVKLRPGLSCSTKIRLCSPDDTKELECSIAYETRRKNKSLEHSYFFVPVVCLPARAVVKVSPVKIRFPCLSWREATGPDGSKRLEKVIKIENTGGKECFCKIIKGGCGHFSDDLNYGEGEMYEDVRLEESNNAHSPFESSTRSSVFCGGESYDEEWLELHEDAIRLSQDIYYELIGNVFATFRFTDKYHIAVPPHSTRYIGVTFTPEYKGFHQEIYVLLFEDCYNTQKEIIELTGDIKKLNLTADPQVLDLKICVINSGVCAGTFKVFNGGKGPCNIWVRIPRALNGHAHVHPKGTIIQSSSHCEFSVRIYPTLTLRKDAGQYYNVSSGLLEFPIFIHPTNFNDSKSDYIKIYAFAIITDCSLELSPSSVNFGTVSTLETVRTPLRLTNHSLVSLEYGFLNLPKGVRVEPNMGFGVILPKESIPLYLLYSPVPVGNIQNRKHSFQVEVTSVAEYGGFRKKLADEGIESVESIWGENGENEIWYNNFPSEEMTRLTPEEVDNLDENQSGEADEEEEYGECHENELSLADGELSEKKLTEEAKIRNYLKLDAETISDHSFFARVNLKGSENEVLNSSKSQKIQPIREQDVEEEDFGPEEPILRPEANLVQCEAIVTEPYCQLSDSVIQLPSTPCSSFSLFRFRVKGVNECVSSNCTCQLRQIKSKHSNGRRDKFKAAFEFQYSCPHIKLEPQSGFFNSGDVLPITIIYKPEISPDDICRESKRQKEMKHQMEKALNKEATLKSSSNSKKNPKEIGDMISSTSVFELEKYDLFAGERSLQGLINPFHAKIKITCIVKTVAEHGGNEETEVHDMILVCPAVKPKFIYLGNSQEINFDKVFVGTRAKTLIEIQNISVERISPAISLFNPVGSFSCLSGLRNIPVDPEHVWCQPLTYAPVKDCGIEKEYFEIVCGTTNVCLLAKGEAITPQYRITPNYACCIAESKMGASEELKFDIDNLNPLKLNLQFAVDYVKEALDVDGDDAVTNFPIKETQTKKETQKKDSTDKKKKTDSEKKNANGWDETPEVILAEVKKFLDVDPELSSAIFNITGVDDNGQLMIPPYGKSSVKIRFSPPVVKQGETNSSKKYAVNYKIALEKTIVLKEILILGVVSRGK